MVGKGRGLVVTSSVKPGELLFASKALAVAETKKLAEVGGGRLDCGNVLVFEIFGGLET